MAKRTGEKPARKRATRAELDERLSNALRPLDAFAQIDEGRELVDPAARQRVRDRAGEEV